MSTKVSRILDELSDLNVLISDTKDLSIQYPEDKLIVFQIDLYFLSNQSVESVFKEDVGRYLEEQKIIYTPHFLAKGSTGLEFAFDFQIAYHHTEIVIKAFNTINKLNLPQFLFTWSDIKKVRERQSGKNVIGLAMINDMEREIKPEYLEAFRSEGAISILWSNRYNPDSKELLRAVNE